MTTVAPMPLTAAESQLCLPEDAVLVFLADTAAAHISRRPACFSLEGGALTQAPVSSISIAEDTACVEAVEWVRGLI